MPQPFSGTDLTDITYGGAGTDDWEIEIREPSVSLKGTYVNGTGYVDDDDSAFDSLSITFNVGGDESFDWAEYDELTLTIDGDAIVINMPPNTIGNGTVYYLDSNGLLFTDAALTTPAVDWVNVIPEDTVTPSDAINEAVESISDSVSVSDTLTMATESISDSVLISDEITMTVIELLDTVTISDILEQLSTLWNEQEQGDDGSWSENTDGDIT